MADDPSTLEAGAVICGDKGVNNLDFHREGRFLLMTTKDSVVHLVDSLAGTEKKKLFTRRDMIGKAIYTHHESCMLLTSEQRNQNRWNDIRYLCVHDNRYLRYFKGHTDKVRSLAMSPIEDNFLSAGDDKSVLLWNINNPSPIAKINLPSNIQDPVVQYDGTGVAFGVQVQDQNTLLHSIKLFDVRAYDNGPFQDIVPDYPLLQSAVKNGMINSGINDNPNITSINNMLSNTTWTDFHFSPDGNHVIINTNNDILFILDGYKEDVEPIAICNRKNTLGVPLGISFSSDAKYVIAGNDENEIQFYDKLNGKLISTLTGHVDAVSCIACNPVYDVMASGCVNTVLWIHQPENGNAMEIGNE
jgi:COMPASS component SWD2